MQLWNVGLYPGGAGEGRCNKLLCSNRGFHKDEVKFLNNKDTVKEGEMSAKTMSSNTKRSPGVGGTSCNLVSF